MIRHIVFFSATDRKDVETIANGLQILSNIPHSTFFEVGINRKVDQLGGDVDIIVYAEFADEAALAAYKADPIYQQCIDLVRPLRDMRHAADFTSKATTGSK